MGYVIEYLKHHKSDLDRMVADGANTEADRNWWAKLSLELETAIERLALLDVSESLPDIEEIDAYADKWVEDNCNKLYPITHADYDTDAHTFREGALWMLSKIKGNVR